MSESAGNHNVVGRVPPRGGPNIQPMNAASGDAAYNATCHGPVGRVPSTGVPNSTEPPRRLRRLNRVLPDRDGKISYLVTICIDGRARVLDNEETFQHLVAFLLGSPHRYRWFGRRFVIMADHIHLIAHMGHDAIPLGQWVKALKAVVGGLKRRDATGAGSGDTAYNATRHGPVGRVPSHGVPDISRDKHEFTRINREWHWQKGFHDHKFRTGESESRKWEYVCLNPVRYGLVKHPEEWPFGGEIFYDEAGGPRLVRGTPPLLATGILIEEETPREGTRPTT